MSLADVQRLIRLPGRLIASPTDVSLAFPYGGTALGLHQGGHFVPKRTYRDIRAQEWGQTVASLIVGEDFYLGAILRGFDPSAVALFFGSETSPSSPPSGETYAARTSRIGSYVADVPVLHIPLDVTAQAVYFPRGIPQIEAAARINLQLTSDAETAVIFKCGAMAPGGSAPPWQIGVLEDLDL